MTVVSFAEKSTRPRDWTQQELATFYRVHNALVQAGLTVFCDRGLTDEGDPWFVFCREDGDIALHFGRADGSYFVAGPTLRGVARSTDFDQLVRGLLDQHASIRPLRSDNVLLHPAALLVMLVAMAIFNGSEADAAEAEKAGRSRGGLDTGGIAAAGVVPTTKEAVHAALIVSAITLLSDPVIGDSARPHEAVLDSDTPSAQVVSSASHGTIDALVSVDLVPAPHFASAASLNERVLQLAPAEASLKVSDYSEHFEARPAPLQADRPDAAGAGVDPHSAAANHAALVEHPHQNASVSLGDQQTTAAPSSPTAGKVASAPSTAAGPSTSSVGSPDAMKVIQTDPATEKLVLSHVDPTLTLSEAVNHRLEQGPHVVAKEGNTGSVPLDVANGSVAPVASVSHVADRPTETHRPSVEQAMQTFTNNTNDYKVVLSGPDVILIDKFAVENSPQLVANVTFDFPDGSHLSLIGLPANLPEGLA